MLHLCLRVGARDDGEVRMAGARLLHDLSRVISFGYRDKQLGGGRKPRRLQDLVVDGVAHDHLRAVVARSIGKVAAFLDHGEPTSARLQFRADKRSEARKTETQPL